VFVVLLMAASQSGCDLINPEEQIPAFIRIDSITMTTDVATYGSPDQNFVDAWVYSNEQLVGIYELPAVVPIYASGESPVRIRAGIKMNGQVGTRIPYLYSRDFVDEVNLFEDSTVHLNPVLTYNPTFTPEWIEGFENPGISLSQSSVSEGTLTRVSGAQAYEGQSMQMHLSAGETVFECRENADHDLPGQGTPVLLEFTYRCNHRFFVGLFSTDQSGTYQIPIIVLNASEDWNRVYVNLTDIVSANASYIHHNSFFGYVRDDGFEGDIDVYIDNIKILY